MATQSHFQELAASFQQFLENGFLCDTILITKNKELRAHSILLAAVSPVFRAAFEESLQPGLQYVELTNFDTETVEVALNFIYTGKLILSSRYTQVDHLLKLFGRLRDLGLEASRLNGCEIRFQTSSDDLAKDSTDPNRKIAPNVAKKASSVDGHEAHSLNFATEPVVETVCNGQKTNLAVSQSNGDKNYQDRNVHIAENISESLHSNECMIENDNAGCNHDNKAVVTVDEESGVHNSEIQVAYSHGSDFVHSGGGGGQPSNTLVGFTLGGHCSQNLTDNLFTSLSNERLSSSEPTEIDGSDSEILKVESDLDEGMVELCQGINSVVKDEGEVYDATGAPQGYYLISTDGQTNEQQSSGNEKQRYSCGICGRILTKKAMKSHSLIHSGERPFECSVCGKTFTMAANLLRHSRLHTGLKPHLCHLCGKSFIQKVTLQDHLAIHLSDKKFKCSICGKLFLKSKQLTEHNHRMHGDEMAVDLCPSPGDQGVIVCDLCGKSYTSKFSFRQHVKLHVLEKPYQCIHCDKSFLAKQNLAQHMINHTGEKPYVCKVCGIAYKRKHLLQWHEHIHTGEKPFVCNVCGKAFAYTCSLKVHIRTHTGERPYKCEICGTAYIQSNHLKVHMRTHTGEKPFVCDLCGKSYKNRLDLRLHSNRVHHINITKSRSVATNNNWQ